jgi:8-oxo-dGTP diphosphatase
MKKFRLWYLNKIKVFQKVIIVDTEGRVLAVKRSARDRRRANCWDLPGGNFEKGERLSESIRREVKEEVSIEIDDLRTVYADSFKAETDTEVDMIAIIYSAKYTGGEIKLSHEHSECKWVSADEFMNLETGEDNGLLKAAVREWVKLGVRS